MHYLVDGHNLIGHVPGIELSDPDDEVQLVDLLHRFVLRNPRLRVTVVFDGGVYGRRVPLDRDRVKVLFARSPEDADARLIELLRTLDQPAGTTLVSADHSITTAAAERGVAVQPPKLFVDDLHGPNVRRQRAVRRLRPEPKQPRAEVEEWLRTFGGDQD